MYLRWLVLCLCALRYRAPLNTCPCRVLVNHENLYARSVILVWMVH